MKLSIEQYELIEAYLSKQLSATDQAEFEQEMRRDEALAQEIRTQQELRMGLRALAIEQRLKTAQHRHNQSKKAKVISLTPTVKTRKIVFTRWLAAASVVLVLSVSVYVFQLQNVSRPIETAFIENYQPDLSDNISKSLPTKFNSLNRKQLEEGIKSYRIGDYPKAISILQTLAADNSTQTLRNYYLGVSYLAKNEPDQAIKCLAVANQSADPSLRHKAAWYLALAHLKKNDRPQMKASLQRIATNGQSPYQHKAKKLLKILF